MSRPSADRAGSGRPTLTFVTRRTRPPRPSPRAAAGPRPAGTARHELTARVVQQPGRLDGRCRGERPAGDDEGAAATTASDVTGQAPGSGGRQTSSVAVALSRAGTTTACCDEVDGRDEHDRDRLPISPIPAETSALQHERRYPTPGLDHQEPALEDDVATLVPEQIRRGSARSCSDRDDEGPDRREHVVEARPAEEGV